MTSNTVDTHADNVTKQTELSTTILTSPEVKRLKKQLNALVDDFIQHDGWGKLEIDMKFLTRKQKEIIIRSGKEYRYVINFQSTSVRPEETSSFCKEQRCPLQERERSE